MNIEQLAISLDKIDDEIGELEIDLLSDKKELEDKKAEKNKLMEALLFYSEFETLYKNNEEFDFDSKLLYPFKETFNKNGDKIFVRKDSKEYKEDVSKYLEILDEAFKMGKIDKETFKEMKEEAIELANKQMDRIEEEEKEKEEEVDLNEDYNKILDDIESTKNAFIINQIGEESYGLLSNNYKNMQEVERKELLYKTHTGLCKEMGISFNMDFTKYDLDTDKTVSNEGYCIKTKDLNSMPYPLDTILLEQTFKLHIGQILNNKNYTPRQKEVLTKMLYDSLDRQKQLVFEKAKKKELKYYGS